MRDIKFRAWDIDSSEMLYTDKDYSRLDFFFDFYETGELSLYMLVECDFPEKRNADIMQFTGLKDKNGVDIYDGDLFHCNGVNYVLRFLTLGGAYTVHDVGNESEERFLHHCNTQIEVIGNIHENHELLK